MLSRIGRIKTIIDKERQSDLSDNKFFNTAIKDDKIYLYGVQAGMSYVLFLIDKVILDEDKSNSEVK